MNTHRTNADTKVSMGCAHTCMQGCGESRDEDAEPAPKGVYHKCGSSNPIDRRVFSVKGTQRSMGKRILTQERDCRARGRAALCWLCGFS